MIELPTLDGEHHFGACSNCPAKTWFDGEYFCDQGKLLPPAYDGAAAKLRPQNCPLPKELRTDNNNSASKQMSVAIATLKRKLYK